MDSAEAQLVTITITQEHLKRDLVAAIQRLLAAQQIYRRRDGSPPRQVPYPALYDLAGNHNAARLLQRLIFWTPRSRRADGVIYKTDCDWWEELRFSREQVKTAKRYLADLVVTQVLRGQQRATHYAIQLGAFVARLADVFGLKVEIVNVEKPRLPRAVNTGNPLLLPTPARSRSSPVNVGFPLLLDGLNDGFSQLPVGVNVENPHLVSMGFPLLVRLLNVENPHLQTWDSHVSLHVFTAADSSTSSRDSFSSSSARANEDEDAAAAKDPDPIQPDVKLVDETTAPTVYALYADNVGALTQILRDELVDLVGDYGEPEVREAIRQAVEYGVRNLAYVRTVLQARRSRAEQAVAVEAQITAMAERMQAPARAAPDVPAEARRVWENAYAQLETRLGRANFNAWLRGAALVGFDAETRTLAVTVRNEWGRVQLETRFAREIKAVLMWMGNVQYGIRFCSPDAEPAGV